MQIYITLPTVSCSAFNLWLLWGKPLLQKLKPPTLAALLEVAQSSQEALCGASVGAGAQIPSQTLLASYTEACRVGTKGKTTPEIVNYHLLFFSWPLEAICDIISPFFVQIGFSLSAPFTISFLLHKGNIPSQHTIVMAVMMLCSLSLVSGLRLQNTLIQ